MNLLLNKSSRIILFVSGYLFSALLCLGFGQNRSQKELRPKFPDNDKIEYLVEFLLDSRYPADKSIERELGKTLEYTKIPYNTIPLNKEKNLQFSPSTRVLVVGNIDQMKNDRVKKIVDFVSRGGTLILAYNGESKKFGFLAGIPFGGDYLYDINAQGYDFQKNLFNNKKHHQFDDHEKHYGLTGSSFSNIEIWATAIGNSTFPAIFQRKLGNGQVIVFNTSKEVTKEYRGLFFAAIMSALPQVPWPVNSTATIFLDDFVSPTYSIQREPVKSSLKLNEYQFLTEVWWPDMAALADEEGITYTTLTCFDYRNYIQPPFTFKEWDNKDNSSNDPSMRGSSSRLLKELRESVHELGFHGYNHVSLQEEDWPSKEFMTLSVNSARKKWVSENYGALPYTYVPPSNIIDEVGLNALKKGMPSIGVMASLYLEDFEEGQNREFDWDPWNNQIFDFPRISSGYVIYENPYFNAKSLFLYTGIWNHFIHHDDIYQIPSGSGLGKGDYDYRNTEERLWKKSIKGKKGLFEEFKLYISQMKKDFPFTDFISAKEASARAIEWRQGNYRHERGEGVYQVSQNNPSGKHKERVWFTYVPAGNADMIDSYLHKKSYAYHAIPWMDGFLYQVKTKNAQISLPDKLTDDQADDISNKIAKIKEDYDNYYQGIPVFDDPQEELDYRIKKGDISEAIQLLQNITAKDPDFNRENWQQLSTFMSWQNRSSEFWTLLQKKYKATSDPDLLRFTSDLRDRIGYPSDPIREYWITLRYESDPENLNNKAEFFTVFGIGKETTDQEIMTLLNSDIKEQFKIDIVSRYLDQYPRKPGLFDSYHPCEKSFLLPHTDRLAYTYADSGQYDKALLWADCNSKIPMREIQEWRIMSGDYQFLKTQDFPRYIEFLLYQKPEEAIEELNKEEPRAIVASQNLNTSIAYLYSDHNLLRKALAWSEFAEDFPILTQLQWEYDLQAYEAMDRRYSRYQSSSPQPDPEVQLAMAQWMLYRREIEKSWALIVTAEKGKKRQSILKELSKDLRYQNLKLKKKLYDKYEDFIDPTLKNRMRKELIRETSNALSTNTKIEADRFETTAIYSDFLYHLKDKNLNTHSFGAKLYKGYGLKVTGDYPLNHPYTAYGIEYGFERAIHHDKVNYSGKIGIEKGEKNNFLFHVRGKLYFSIDSLFSSISVTHKPAETAPARHLKIYQSTLSIYEELQINNRYTATLLLEGNLFTKGGKSSKGLLQFARKWKVGNHHKITPYLETSGTLGNRNFTNGYPYWAIDRRLNGGVGVGYIFENRRNKQKYAADAAYFFDSYSTRFQRYQLEIQQPISAHFYLTGGAEFYTIKNFYNNNFRLGLVVYLP